MRIWAAVDHGYRQAVALVVDEHERSTWQRPRRHHHDYRTHRLSACRLLAVEPGPEPGGDLWLDARLDRPTNRRATRCARSPGAGQRGGRAHRARAKEREGDSEQRFVRKRSVHLNV